MTTVYRTSLPRSLKPMLKFTLPLVGGGEVQIGETVKPGRWTYFSVYRGIHCPLCRRYNSTLETYLKDLDELGIDVVFLSMDTKEKAEKAKSEWGLTPPVAYGLTPAQAFELGCYVTENKSDSADPKYSAEAGQYLVNPDGMLAMVDISNVPILRPNVEHLVEGLKFILGNKMPMHVGTYERTA